MNCQGEFNMKAREGVHLPTARYCVKRPVYLLAEPTIAAKRNVVSNVARKVVCYIEEARSPFRFLVIKILPIGRSRSGLSASAVVSDRIRQAPGPSIVPLERKSLLQTFLGHDLQRVVTLITISSCPGNLADLILNCRVAA